MEVDDVASGVMKTPTVPDKEDRTEDLPGKESFLGTEGKSADTDLDATVALEADQAQILADVEQERLRLEESEGEEEAPSAPLPQEDEPFFEPQEGLYEQESLAPPVHSRRKRLPFFLAGGFAIILIVAILGYFLLSSPEKASKPDKLEVAVPKKNVKHVASSTSRKKAAARKQKSKKAEVESRKPEKTATLVLPGKAEPAAAAKTDEGTVIQMAEPAKPLPETKEPEVPGGISEITPAKPTATKPQPATATPASPEPAATPTEPHKTKTVAEAPKAFLASLPSSSESGPYSVHVGSFRRQGNAFLLRDKLRDKGYPAFCRFVKIPDKGDWYRVQVGYFASLEDANQVESKLKKEEKVYARILKR